MFEGSDIVIALVLSGISVILTVAEYLVNKFRALFMVGGGAGFWRGWGKNYERRRYVRSASCYRDHDLRKTVF